jgi:hypothetical protein
MIDIIWNWIQGHQGLTAVLAVASVVMFVGSRLPVDYFLDPRRHTSRLRSLHPALYLSILVVKNLLGWILLLAGLAMLVLPGQGLLTMLMGLVLCDFPGKFALERRLACRPSILGAINWLRRKAGHGPMLAPRRPDGSPCSDPDPGPDPGPDPDQAAP